MTTDMLNLEKPLPRLYQVILDSIADGVYTVDLNWRVTSFNKAAETITGIKRKEAIGQPCFEVLRSNMCENHCLLKRVMEARQSFPIQPIYIIRADKKRIPINVSTAILKDAGNKMIGGVMTFRDLTDINKLQRELKKQHTFEDIVSKNDKMLDIFAILPQIAQSASTVLIEGESGTGKELFARAIHHHSTNASGPFVAVNCGALPDTLIESELFGYKAGAFTDAKKDKPGRFDQAQGGTILLDEIGDISAPVQTKLLRVLERKEYEPLGAVKPIKLNSRIIAATHRHLHQLSLDGDFREDLFYRINVVRLQLPPLRDRKEDIPLLTHHFIERFNSLLGRSLAGISHEALGILMLHDWPGNVRELENAVEHAFVMCRGDVISPECFPSRIRPKNRPVGKISGMTLKACEKETIFQALERNQWKRMKTATELNIDKNTLRRKIIRHGIVNK
jgi:PAS domain S-box-containing protein